MESIRERNIERNNKFLESIGLLVPQNQNEDDSSVVSSEPGSETKEVIETKIVSIDSINQQYLFRENHIETIALHCTSLMKPSLPLLISGPAGSGKYGIAKDVINMFSPIGIYFSCSGWKLVKEFLNALWIHILSEVKKKIIMKESCSKTVAKANQKEFSLFVEKSKCLFQINDFTTALKGLFQFLEIRREKRNEKSVPEIHILLHRVDLLEFIQKDFSSKIIHLSKLCNKNIRITATCYSCTFENSQEYFSLIFQPYSKNEMLEIIKFKLQSNQTNDRFEKENNEKEIIQNNMFFEVIHQCLEKLLIYTTNLGMLIKHIQTIKDTCTSWQSQQNENFKKETKSNDTFEFQKHIDNSIHNILTYGVFINSNSNDNNNDITLKSSSSNLNSSNIIPELVISNSHLYNMTPCCKYLILASYIAGANPKESDGHTFGLTQRGKRKHTRNESSTGSNKKIKSKDLEQEEDLKNNETEEVLKSAREQKYIKPPRQFSLERILGIFIQIANISQRETSDTNFATFKGKKIRIFENNVFKDDQAQIYNQIKSLCDQRMLIKSSNYEFDNPSFYSNISSEYSSVIAKSIDFPLKDFIFQE